MKFNKGTFIVVPNRDNLCGIKADIQSVYLWICRFADDKGVCFPSMKKLSESSGVSKRRVVDCIKFLDENGFLDRINRTKNGSKTSNLYQINILEAPSAGDALVQEVHKGSAGGAQGVVQEVPITETHSEGNTYKETHTANKFAIDRIIELFKELSPSLEYGNTTQRKACSEMLKLWSLEKLEPMVLKVIKSQGEKFAPRAVTPHAMWIKIGEFKGYFNKGVNKTLEL